MALWNRHGEDHDKINAHRSGGGLAGGRPHFVGVDLAEFAAGGAWLNGLNPFCRRPVEHDLRVVGPDLFVQYWERLRGTLQKLERDFGPSDNWK
jgi:hypothetical protein